MDLFHSQSWLETQGTQEFFYFLYTEAYSAVGFSETKRGGLQFLLPSTQKHPPMYR